MTDIQSAAHVEVQYVEYAALVPDDDNVRLTLTGIRELADSIWAAGLINPITVRPMNGDAKYHITAGYRRHAAIGLLIEEQRWNGKIPVMVRTDEDDESRMVAMIVENLQRVDVNPVDEALGIQRLVVQYGFTLDDVVLNLAVSERVIKDRLALCQLSENAMAAVRAGKMSVESGVLLSKAPAKLQDKIAKGSEYDCTPSRVKAQIGAAASSDFKNEVKAKLKALDVEIDKESYNTPKGFTRTDHALVLTPSKLDELRFWVQTHVKSGDLVRLQSHYQEAKVTLDHYSKLDAKTLAKQEAQFVEAKAEQAVKYEETIKQAIEPEVWAWYEECKAIAEQVEEHRNWLENLEAVHRPAFVRKLATSDVAAAALHKLALTTADIVAQYYSGHTTEYYRPAHEYAYSVLGIDETNPPCVLSDRVAVRVWVLADKKRIITAAALNLMPRATHDRHAVDLETKFDEAMRTIAVEEGEPEIITFPAAPDSLNAKLVAAQGMTFEEANAGEITWENIEATIDALAEGDFDTEPEPLDSEEQLVKPEEEPSDSELAAIEAEGEADDA